MAAETVAEEMVENVTEEVAETEIVTVKMAETDEVGNFQDFSGGYPPNFFLNMVLNGLTTSEKENQNCSDSCIYYNVQQCECYRLQVTFTWTVLRQRTIDSQYGFQ